MFSNKNNPVLQRLVDTVKILQNKVDHIISNDDSLGEALNVQQRHVIQRLTNLEQATAWMKDLGDQPIKVKSVAVEKSLGRLEAKVDKIDSAMDNYLYILTEIKKIMGDQFATQKNIVDSLLESNGRLREAQRDVPVVMPPKVVPVTALDGLDPENEGAALLAQPLVNQQHRKGTQLRTVEDMLLNCLKWRNCSVEALVKKDLGRFSAQQILAALLEMMRQKKHPITCKINVSNVKGVTARRLIFGFSQRIAPNARLSYKKALQFRETIVDDGTPEARVGGDVSPNQSYRSVTADLEAAYPHLRNKSWG